MRTLASVPRISAFYGIVIWMYHDEIQHLGRPHFHASYGGDEASIDIEGLDVLAGRLPPRALRLVVEWARQHQPELRANWDLARRSEPLRKVAPLQESLYHRLMRSTPLLVSATPTERYGVHVVFEDGTVGDVDLSYLPDRGGVFAPLRDEEYFRRLRADAEAGTIVWPNDADIAPETLYAHARGRQAATA